MAYNTNLNVAKKAKNDEFYTRLDDISNELMYYRDALEGKSVLCNCDNPFISNFFKYFAANFEKLGLKQLTTTCCASKMTEGIAGAERNKPYIARITDASSIRDVNNLDDWRIAELLSTNGNSIEVLDGTGSFDSDECLRVLDETDIIVTNPPFSLFRDYIGVLHEHDARFLIIGSINAITYRDVIPLLVGNEAWLGCTYPRAFLTPYADDGSRSNVVAGKDGNGLNEARFGNICWYTNLDNPARHRILELRTMAENLRLVRMRKRLKSIDAPIDRYPVYDNYDAIEVPYTSCIPSDYDGVMGVPITFMTKYNPDQFEILGGINPSLNGRKLYKRLLVRSKAVS